MHPVVIYCTAALGGLLFLLGLAVSILRLRTRIGAGPAPDRNAPLNRVIRRPA